MHSIRYIHYLLLKKENFELKEDVISEIKKGADLLFLTNPNNPTGRCINEKLLIKIIECCKECGCAVVVDECFLRLSSDGVSVKKLINKYEGLFVVDAFTKLFAMKSEITSTAKSIAIPIKITEPALLRAEAVTELTLIASQITYPESGSFT